MVWCLRVRGRAALSARGGQSTKSSRTVREEPADRVFIVFFACSCAFVFRSVSLVVFGREELVGKSAQGGQTVCEARTVRKCSADRPFFEVQYWKFEWHFRTASGTAMRVP
jgi:hypothetical protein